LNGPKDSNDWSIIVVGNSDLGTTVEVLEDVTSKIWKIGPSKLFTFLYILSRALKIPDDNVL